MQLLARCGLALFLITAGLIIFFADNSIMEKSSVVSQELLNEFKDHPQKHRNVLIGCTEGSEHIRDILEKEGISISGEMKDLGIFHAKIDYSDLTKIQTIRGIEWVEIDEEVQVD